VHSVPSCVKHCPVVLRLAVIVVVVVVVASVLAVVEAAVGVVVNEAAISIASARS